MDHYKLFCGLNSTFGSFNVFTRLFVSLWVLMNFFAFLCVLMDPYKFLGVLMDSKVCLWALEVLICPDGF